ncbi:hypothetical protein [Streptomyces sp. FH025]|uniref:hypothetical protein n=1 Tax=Streptomyces sp. FH025 TaxID=2815937 RepID=UPI001A9F89F1|nr:hypothetical protein [Streptomyces sp. FH025]MBO1414459.1 hypothetical protein [Streptomyces sp. FH025]
MDGGGRAGGSVGLIRLLDKHGAEITADLRRYCGVDVLDWFRGRHSARFVLALIGTLPDDSATVAALRGGREALGWDARTYVLADLVDAVQALTHVQVAKAAKNPRTVEKPSPYPRPYAKKSRRPTGTSPFAAALQREVGEGGGPVLAEPPSPLAETFRLPAAVLARSTAPARPAPVRLT